VETRNTGARVTVFNEAAYDIQQFWLAHSGEEVTGQVLGAFSNTSVGSYPGHAFIWRKLQTGEIVWFDRIPDDSRYTIRIPECGLDHGLNVQLFEEGRDKEFEGLVVPDSHICKGEDSTKWACSKYWTYEEVENRPDGRYGFEVGEGTYGKTVDTSYTAHIPKMLRVTEGPGYLIMEMTDKLKELLIPWYHHHKNTPSEIKHGNIPGGYTNVHKISITKIPLDDFSDVHSGIVKEMQQVLQWWTQIRLKHTSTFGCRIYKRGSMLINHVDRSDTHIASAVLQVAQRDIDEGWPLELMINHPETRTPDEHQGRIEIYLQPGQMVLYEGGYVMHGRPMRLQGEEFGNVFSHFAPITWFGPYKKYEPYHDEL